MTDTKTLEKERAIVSRGGRLGVQLAECLGHASFDVGWSWIEWNGCSGLGTASSASVIESSAPLIALRTVSHRWLTLQYPVRSHMAA